MCPVYEAEVLSREARSAIAPSGLTSSCNELSSPATLAVVRSILSWPREVLERSLPRTILTRLRDQRIPSIRELLVAPRDEIGDRFELSGLAIALWEDWIWRSTGSLGVAMTAETVRGVLLLSSAAVDEAPHSARVARPAGRDAVRSGHWSIAELVAALSQDLRETSAASLPGLSVRAIGAFDRNDVVAVGDLANFSDEDMMQWSNFGTTSFRNLKAVLGALAAREQLPQQEHAPPELADSALESIASLAAQIPPAFQGASIREIPDLSARVLTALPAHGLCLIGDLVSVQERVLLSWSNFGEGSLESLREGLKALHVELEELDALEFSNLDALRDARLTMLPLMELVKARVARMQPLEQQICTERTLCSVEPATLAVLASRFKVSRERVRQLELDVRGRLDVNGDLVLLIDRRLSALRAARSTPLRASELEELDAWFAGVRGSEAQFGRLLAALGAEHGVDFAATSLWTVSASRAIPVARGVEEFKARFGRQTSLAELDSLLEGYLAEVGALELHSLYRENLGDVVESGGQVVFAPTLVQRIEAVFEQAEGPLSIREVESRLRRAAIPFSPHAVRGGVGRIDLVRTGPSEYIHPRKLIPWERHLCAVIEEIRPLMQADVERQWSTSDLLGVLRDEGHAWADSMPEHALAYILSRNSELVEDLGRGIWVLAERRSRAGRLRVVDVCESVLEAAGRPLTSSELVARIRQVRSIYYGPVVYWPVVQLEDGRLGLGSRDLGIPQDVFERVHARVTDALTTVGRVAAAELRQWTREACPALPEIPAWILARALRTSSRVLLDGDGKGDGLRRHDVEREAGVSAVVELELGAGGECPSPVIPGNAVLMPLDSAALERILQSVEEDISLSELSVLLRDSGHRPLGLAALRMRLRLSGWQEQPVSGRWIREPNG
ncbi:MAG: hypothetical protein H6826_04005 [Planctomycetes bacterium]|nr:hypothetical protein [Planctomycetota bacterium]